MESRVGNQLEVCPDVPVFPSRKWLFNGPIPLPKSLSEYLTDQATYTILHS